jgi:hypothetical protein
MAVVRGSVKSHFMYYVLDLLSLRPFASKVVSGQPGPTLIHQNHIIHKEHAPSDTTFYVSCDLIHHKIKKR